MSDKKHPFTKLSELVEEYAKNKNSYDSEKLQDLRDNISLTLFYLSDSASQSIANYEKAEHDRKTKMAEMEQKYRDDVGSNGKSMTVAEAQNLARIDCKEEVEDCKTALRQKERVRIILAATKNILNSISSRIHMTQK